MAYGLRRNKYIYREIINIFNWELNILSSDDSAHSKVVKLTCKIRLLTFPEPYFKSVK